MIALLQSLFITMFTKKMTPKLLFKIDLVCSDLWRKIEAKNPLFVEQI